MSWNLQRNTVLSGASAASRSTPDFDVVEARGLQVIVDFTATPNNAETFTLVVEAKDPASGKYVPVTTFTALTASALGAAPTAETYVYTLYPGAVETAATVKHEVQGLPLPPVYRVRGAHSAAGSWTYTVSLAELP